MAVLDMEEGDDLSLEVKETMILLVKSSLSGTSW
jgi:hypothetical protein